MSLLVMPGSSMDRLLRLVRRHADAKLTLPGNAEIAHVLGIDFYQVPALLKRAEERGLIRMSRRGRDILGIEAPDGSWSVLRGADARDHVLPKRRCLRCRHAFQPEHRHRFLCTSCNLANGCEVA